MDIGRLDFIKNFDPYFCLFQELSMLEEVSSAIRQNGGPRFGQLTSNGLGHMSHNQSIYANTIALPKMNGNVITGRGTIAPPMAGTTANGNGLNSSKVSSSTSPGTNQTKTSIMESSRDQGPML